MRYIGRDDSYVYIKCRKCKKIHAYNREHYEEHFEKNALSVEQNAGLCGCIQ